MTSSVLWRPDTDQRPPLVSDEVYRPDILAVIERTIDDLRPALRALSDKIHGECVLGPPPLLSVQVFDDRPRCDHERALARPELKFEEQ